MSRTLDAINLAMYDNNVRVSVRLNARRYCQVGAQAVLGMGPQQRHGDALADLCRAEVLMSERDCIGSDVAGSSEMCCHDVIRHRPPVILVVALG